MKRFLIVLFNFIFFFTFIKMPATGVLADDINEERQYVQVFPQNNTPVPKAQMPRIDASAAIIMDMGSGRVLYEKNAYVRRAMASTTKIMTAIVALENGNLNDEVTTSKRAASISGSVISLRTGEKMKLSEMLYGLLMESGNDAAIAIAEHVGGSVENFCEMMNQKALELGAPNTHFTSPHGLDAPEHYTTAYELALITKYALKNPTFAKIVSTRTATIPNRSLYNTNELLGVYPGTIGVKTGYTGQAGRCLVTAVNRNNWGGGIISVVLGSPTRNARAQSSKNILDYAFTNYSPQTLLKERETLGQIPVIKGITPNVKVEAAEEITLPLRKDELDVLQKQVVMKDILDSPVSANIEVGTIRYTINEKVIAESAIVTSADVRRKTFTDYFHDIILEWGKIIRQAGA